MVWWWFDVCMLSTGFH